jgi:hypothetical protein
MLCIRLPLVLGDAMTKDEALKLALEALCVAVEPKKGKVYAREFEPIDCFAMHEQAIIAIREAWAEAKLKDRNT